MSIRGNAVDLVLIREVSWRLLKSSLAISVEQSSHWSSFPAVCSFQNSGNGGVLLERFICRVRSCDMTRPPIF
jgi:hypothetical protein